MFMKKMYCLMVVFFTLTTYSQQKFSNFNDAYSFFQKNLVYPETAVDSNAVGYVLAKFTIKKGNVLNVDILFAEEKYICNATISVINKSNGKWLFNLPYEDSTNILLPIYFFVEMDDGKTVKKLVSEKPRLPFRISKKDALIPNLVLMRPLVFTMTVILDKFMDRSPRIK